MKPVSILTLVATFLGFSILVEPAMLVAEEAPVEMTELQQKLIVARAPQCPVADDMQLSLELIDFIDCTSSEDIHPFKDQGTSSVVTGPAGTYRQTAAHRHAFFSYRFKSAGKDKPVLILIEYPDDSERTINFSTHESVLSGKRNIDWSLETGVYTGGPYPLTDKMQYHSFIFWPQDSWPALLVGNFHRYGHPAAAARIWVYKITEKLPALTFDTEIAAAKQRRLGHFNSLGWYLPTRLYFGYNSPDAIAHMLEYCQYVGINELAWPVISGNGYRFNCTVDTWDANPTAGDHLDKVLEAMDAVDGMSFAAGFNFSEDFLIGGTAIKDMTDEQLRKALMEGLREFLNRYGKYKSLRKIMIGAQYGIGLADYLSERGMLEDVVGFLRQRRPDIQVLTFIGGRALHEQYFDGKKEGELSASDIIDNWEQSGQNFSDYLGSAALSQWKSWGHAPEKFAAIDGLTIYEQYQPDDFAIFPLYSNQPRSLLYYDLDRSQARSDYINSDYAAIWNTHFEGWYGLHPEVNYWYQKLWVAPDFSAAGEMATDPYIRALGHHDRLALMPGSWNFKYFGHETEMRRFAKYYRQLPTMTMQPLTSSSDSVKFRWKFHLGKRYVQVLNLSPFADTAQVDETVVNLKPFDLVTVVHTARREEPKVSSGVNIEYGKWIQQRLHRMEILLRKLDRLDPSATGQAFVNILSHSRQLIEQHKYYAADITMAPALLDELQLRLDILQPPAIEAGKLTLMPDDLADFDTWPRAAGVLDAAGGEFLAGHTYFPNSWTGEKDLSASMRISHNGEKLFFAVKVYDSKLTEKDRCRINLSTDGAYKDWHAKKRKFNVVWNLPVPLNEDEITADGEGQLNCTSRRTDYGYIVTGTASMDALSLSGGDEPGILLSVYDNDDEPNIFTADWAIKQLLLAPNKPNFHFSDARNAGRLILGR